MSTVLKRGITWVVALCVLSLPLAARVARAESPAPEPLIVMSVASTDRMLGDIGDLMEATGAGDIGRLLVLMTAPYTAALERDQPVGMYATLREVDQMEAVGFLPVRDLQMLLRTLQDQLGTPRDAGDGVQELAVDQPQTVFVREQDGWAFFADRKALLMDLPAEPAALLGDLPERYTMAVRLHVPAIPAEIRQMAIQQIQQGFEEAMQDQLTDDLQVEFGRLAYQSQIDTIATLMDDAESLTVGWRIASEDRCLQIEVALQALEGSTVAHELSRIAGGTPTDFAGLLHPDAAAAILMTAPALDADVQQSLAIGALVRNQVLQGIQDDPNLSEPDRAEATQIMHALTELGEQTIRAAKNDTGACLILKPDSIAVVAGGYISDGEKLAGIVQRLHALAQRLEPRTPDVHFNAEVYQGVTMHTTAIPLRDADAQARQLLGDPLDVVIGTGARSVYLAFGQDAAGVLKAVVDASTEQNVPPVQAFLALESILEFAASVDDNPILRDVLDAVKQSEGGDRIRVAVVPVERGVAFQLSVDQAVGAAVGQGVRLLAPLVQDLIP